MKLDANLNPLDLYRYSIFFRNYIENVAEDTLKNGITLLKTGAGGVVEEGLCALKVELKEALLNAVISYRFNGVGYILIRTHDDEFDLESEVLNELPIGFTYLDYLRVRDRDYESSYITYSLKTISQDEDAPLHEKVSIREVRIHKSRVIIYENYDYILNAYTPVYTKSFLLNIYLFEKIYSEIEKKISNHNFLFYKDEYLVELQDALTNATASVDLLTKNNSSGGLFKNLFASQQKENADANISTFKGINNALESELTRLKNNLNNEGIFYTATPNASLEVVKYDLAFLKEALELVKAKIGADTKEPLTRSFNEQTKGLGSDGKGDRSNYYDFLKGVQENIENAVNSKLNKYYGLDMRFNSLVLLTDEQKIEADNRLMDTYSKYLSLIREEGLSDIDRVNLSEKLFFLEKNNKN
ncbi:phage portal protein (plasmid) [Borrelia turcica IST7]|uniref:Phage portal protein n=1 Tax=Borrelia turcica IST7 TaxID=1104446 RepID=A0A386PRS5_9SPIR|nr:anti-CBASS Acb1 family protein [Borrelia turcica]AYE37110.1 phage portal protein [Borrelia turcica IST7]